MSKMATKKWLKRAGAVALCAAAITGTVLGVGYGTGLFSSTNESTFDEGSGLIVGDSIGNGISLSTTTVGPTASTYTLKATIKPSYATNTGITWSLGWDTTWGGYDASGGACEDVSGSEWTDSLSSLSIEDYVTLSATTGSTVVVTCNKAFGNPIIVTATSDDDTNLTASCKLDYHVRITDVTLTNLGERIFSTSDFTTSYTEFYISFSTGTVTGDYEVTYSVSLWEDWFTDLLFNEISSQYSSYTDWKSLDYVVTSGTTTLTASDNQFSLFSYSRNISTFVEGLLAEGVTYNDGHLSDFYSVMNNLDLMGMSLSDARFYRTGISFTDTFTGEVYSLSGSITFDSTDGLDIPVTGISLNENNVVM